MHVHLPAVARLINHTFYPAIRSSDRSQWRRYPSSGAALRSRLACRERTYASSYDNKTRFISTGRHVSARSRHAV